MELTELCKNEINDYTKEATLLRKEYRNMPKGRLECHRRNNNGWSWFVVKNGKRQYLSKRKHAAMAERLAYKRIVKNRISVLEHKINVLENFIADYDDIRSINPADKRATSNEEINKLSSIYYDRTHPKETEWRIRMEKEIEDNIQKFKGKEINEEEYPVISVWGLRFRSKTEALIYDRLRANDLLVLYEPDMMLGDYNISPDFVIINKRTGKEYIWEHFGRMKDPAYIYKNKKKFSNYIDHGYIPNINMIATYEINDNSINLRYIESLIEQFLI